MQNDTYVLDLLVTGAEAVSVIDDGTGTDTIRVAGQYAATIDIDLAWTVVNGTPYSANSRFVSAQNSNHQLVIYGQIENAFGSNGTELITGNAVDNLLRGDQRRTGLGADDTLWGDAGDDTLYGGSSDDDQNGEGDNDALYGNAGADSLTGGLEGDTLDGGAGADRLDGGGDAGDTLCYATARAGVFLQLQAEGITLGHGGDAEGDQISGFANITGSTNKHRIFILDKAALPDDQSDNVVDGGRNRDKIAVGGGDDMAYGVLGNDFIYGEIGDDTLFGGSGRDLLFGGYGQDVMTGGSGTDGFVFAAFDASSTASPDVITDFSSLELDRIDLREIDAVRGLGSNQAFHFITGAFTGWPANCGPRCRAQALSFMATRMATASRISPLRCTIARW